METKEIATDVAEMPLYNVVKDGNGTEYKIANANNPKNCPQFGVFTIEAIRRNKFKQPDIGFSLTKDPQTNIIYGIPSDVHPEKKTLRFRRIRLGDVEQFDCSIQSEREMWCAISHCQFLEGSPLAMGKKPLYKMHDVEADARKIIKLSKDKRRASEIAENLQGSDLYDMAVNLGKSTEHNSFAVLLSEVIKEAEINPKNFLDIYENSNREIITVFNRCRVVGLIKSDLQNGFMWKESYPLGMSEAAAHSTIAKNPQLLMTMDMESKERDQAFQRFATGDQRKVLTPKNIQEITNSSQEFLTTKDLAEKISEMNASKKELDDSIKKQKELNEKLEAFLSSQVKEKAVKKVVLDDAPIEDLQEEAHKLGFAKARTIDDVSVLQAEIAKRKK